MNDAILSKWKRIERGLTVTVGPSELQRVKLRDFVQIAKDTGLHVVVHRVRPGWYRVGVK